MKIRSYQEFLKCQKLTSHDQNQNIPLQAKDLYIETEKTTPYKEHIPRKIMHFNIPFDINPFNA